MICTVVLFFLYTSLAVVCLRISYQWWCTLIEYRSDFRNIAFANLQSYATILILVDFLKIFLNEPTVLCDDPKMEIDCLLPT